MPENPPKLSDATKPTPRPLTTRERKLVAALDRYIKYADAADPDLPGVLFLKANTYRRNDQLDVAIPMFRVIVERYPRQQVAEYAANLLLDSYNRLEQYDQLLAFADQIAKDAVFLRDREDLAHTVAMVQRQDKRKRAEQLESAAQESKDWDTYVATGKAYLEIYNANPGSRENDEVLYNAGVAFEGGHAFSEALRMYGLLEKYYPNSRITAKAVARTGKMYGDIAMYEKAAEKLEQYAKRYAGEKDAYYAMSEAIYFRKALGDRAKAIEDTKYFIKTYGAKKPTEAADASWSLTALYEPDADTTIKHLEDYLRQFGSKGGPERVAIAHAKIGALLWKQSCPHALVDGLCVKVKDRTPRTCGKGTAQILAVTVRNPKASERALAAFALAGKEFERRGGQFPDPGARYHYAQARLAQIDAELEAYLSMSVPRGLSFDPANSETRTANLKRLDSWLNEKRKIGGNVTGKYEAVMAIKDVAGTITAASRLGIVVQTLASALVTAELPRQMKEKLRPGTVSTSGARAAHCEALADVAAPLEARAVSAFSGCLAKSTELSWFADSSAYCERQLFELAPDDFPPASERRSQPLFAAPVVVIEPPVR